MDITRYSKSVLKPGWVNEANKYGPFEILFIEQIDRVKMDCRIRFLDKNIFGENTEITISGNHAIETCVRDPYQATVYGMAAVGQGYKKGRSRFDDKLNDIWRNMVKHCNKHPDQYRMTDPRIRCFETFCQDIQSLENYNLFKNNINDYTIIKKFGYVEYTMESLAIVNKNINITNTIRTNSGFRGVIKNGNSYTCRIDDRSYGAFSNPIASASMYNHIMRERGMDEASLNNHITEMSVEEALTYLTKRSNDMNMIKPSFNFDNYNSLKGVIPKDQYFLCAVNHNETYGLFSNFMAAASMYNLVMRYRGYPNTFLNNIGEEEMSPREILQYRIDTDNQTEQESPCIFYNKPAPKIKLKEFNIDYSIIYPNQGDPVKIIEVLPKEPTNERLVNIRYEVPNMFGFNTIATRVKYYRITHNKYYQDPYKPHILGVACYGNRYNMIPDHGREYKIWHSIIGRCCDPNNTFYPYYGGIGVKVCERWHCFEYFLLDVVNLSGYDLWKARPGEYELDKDILQQNVPDNQKMYSPSTCIFVRKIDNIMERHYRKSVNSTGYMGVFTNRNNDGYYVLVNSINYGTYPTAEIAAALYNQISQNLNGVAPRNNVPYMPINEILSHRHTRATSKPDDCIIKAATGLDTFYKVVEDRRYMTDEQALDNLFNRFVKK